MQEEEKWFPEGSAGPKASVADRFLFSPITSAFFIKIGLDNLPAVTEPINRGSFLEAVFKGLPVALVFGIAAAGIDVTLRGSQRVNRRVLKDKY